jgi:hypothetical protein
MTPEPLRDLQKWAGSAKVPASYRLRFSQPAAPNRIPGTNRTNRVAYPDLALNCCVGRSVAVSLRPERTPGRPEIREECSISK